jgi:predicted dehydrogenase
MDKKTYRVAVVGGAGMWGRHYLRTFAQRDDCDVVLVDPSRERARQFADHFGVEEVIDSLDELLKRETPDIVATILPVRHSYEAVLACAEAGVKAVSCEKPMAIELSQADEMVRVCREKGTAFGCATAYWEVPFLQESAQWLREGHIGPLTAASIPGGLPREVSGAGCVQLTQMRLVTGMEVEWVEGWVLPPEPGWTLPEGAQEYEIDCPAYGRLGLSGGMVCEIPAPRDESEVRCRVWVEGEEGQAWFGGSQSVFIKGKGAESTPVEPDFLQGEWQRAFHYVCERLVRAVERGDGQLPCSGHDYRQALEIALALKLSARNGHERVALPLTDRSLKIYPHDYRLRGGDVAGWQSIGYEGPPQVEGRAQLNRPK